jgi:CRP-like cAMP-binding protein
LSIAAATAGGITRDVLIGAIPPAALLDWRYLGVACLAGDLFGEISLLTKQPPTATCTAATDAKLFILPKRYLGEIVKRHPAVLSLMRKKARERLDRTVHSQKKLSASRQR